MDHPQGLPRTYPKLPLIISVLRYTFGAPEACFEVLGCVCIFLLMRILCCCAWYQAQRCAWYQAQRTP